MRVTHNLSVYMPM